MFIAISILIFLAAKAWTGASVLGTATLLTITEAGAIVVTFLLARWVSSAISEFEDVIARITVGPVAEQSLAGQGLIYREVRRARNYERPMALMAVAVEKKSAQVALDRMVQEAQLTMMKQYALSGVSRVLCEELEDSNVVVRSNDHFLIGLPEVTPEHLPGPARRRADDHGDHLAGIKVRLRQNLFKVEGFKDKKQ